MLNVLFATSLSWEHKRTHLSRVVRSAWHRKAPLNLSVFLPYFLPLAPNITRYYMTQDKTRKILKPLQIKGFGTRRDYLTRRHMQFESLLLRQIPKLLIHKGLGILFILLAFPEASTHRYRKQFKSCSRFFHHSPRFFLVKHGKIRLNMLYYNINIMNSIIL